ncbi:hypothetical protein AURDEDRAFT_164477 [Auricularia subglabra TFB-10046 SS5]|nr:hypothetical protein AURDEDRAFT_164477 [Auricularia subglabra TFB-10046 SS5]
MNYPASLGFINYAQSPDDEVAWVADAGSTEVDFNRYHPPPPVLFHEFPLSGNPESVAFAVPPPLGLTCSVHSVQTTRGAVTWRLYGSTTSAEPRNILGATPGDIYWVPEDHSFGVWQMKEDSRWSKLDTSITQTAKHTAHPTVNPQLPLRFWPQRGDKVPKYVTGDSSGPSVELLDLAPPPSPTVEYMTDHDDATVPEVPADGPEPSNNSQDPPLAPETIQGIRGGLAIRGSELPANADVIQMLVDGQPFDICLPYISNSLYQKENVKENYDSMIRDIKQMASGLSPSLRDAGFVSYDASEPDLDRKIAEALGRNCVIRVRNYTGEGLLAWEDAYKWQRPQSIVHPLCRRKAADEHKRMTLRNFIETSTDVSKCYNLLDCSSHRQSPPTILAEREALEATRDHGLFLAGISGVEIDMLTPLEWYLMAHSGYYTRDHHDSCGYCTYIWVQCGVKLWSWHRVPPHLRSRQYASNVLSSQLSTDSPVDGLWYTARLGPGDVLIQPPNLVHRVYTAERSIVKGGHFYCWQALHLTELARSIDVDHNSSATNEDHPSAARLLARMAMSIGSGYFSSSLPPFFGGISERCLLALFRMVHAPGDFVVKPIKKRPVDGTLTKDKSATQHAYPIRPEGSDRSEDDWSDPEDRSDLPLEFKPPQYKFRSVVDATEQDEYADFLLGSVVLRLAIGATGALERSDPNAPGSGDLAWDEPGEPLHSLPELPMAEICRTTHKILVKTMPRPNKEHTAQLYTLDLVREFEHIDEIVDAVSKHMQASAKRIEGVSHRGSAMVSRPKRRR